MEEIHDRKRHDYSAVGYYQNFERSALLASWFKNDQDKAFVVLIGTKLARLAALLDSKEPLNESIDDTFLDLNIYCGLWSSMRAEMREVSIFENHEFTPKLEQPSFCSICDLHRSTCITRK